MVRLIKKLHSVYKEFKINKYRYKYFIEIFNNNILIISLPY